MLFLKWTQPILHPNKPAVATYFQAWKKAHLVRLKRYVMKMFQEILLEIEKESFTSLFKRGRDRQGGEIENWRGQGWHSLWQIGEENVNLFNFVFD